MKSSLTIFCLAAVLSLSSQLQSQDSPKWFLSPSSVTYPSGVYVMLPQTDYIHPVTQPRIVVTSIGTFVVTPSLRVHPSSTQQTEVPLVRHPTNANIMFGSSNATLGFFISEGVYVTTDGGINWFGSDTLNAGGNLAQQRGDPGPTIDVNGRFIMTHLTSNSVFGGVTGMGASYSTNNGLTWSANVQISPSSSDDKNLAATNDVAGPFLGHSYIAWTRFSSVANGYFSRTTDGGVTWSAPLQLNTSVAHYAQGHDLGQVGPAGQIYVCWTAGITSSPFTEDYVGFSRSTDGGLSFTTTENIYDVNGTRSFSFNGWSIRTNGFPRISTDRSGGSRNGWIYIVTDEFNLAPAGSDADVILHRSTDGGTTWSAGVRVNQDPMNNGKVQFFPCIKVDETGGVNVVYYDNRNFPSVGDSCSVYMSRSTDGGVTWADVEVADHHFRPKPTPGLGGGYMGDYIGVTTGNGKVWPFWTDDKAGPFQAWTTGVSVTTTGGTNQPDVWCANFPTLPGSGVLWGHASVALNDTVYVVGGSSTGGPSTTMYKYSIVSNSWTTGASLPGPKCGGDLAATGGKIYYIGGGNTIVTTGTPEQYVYTPSTGTWSTIANIPSPVTGNVAEVYRDTIIYCMMGGWTTYLTTVQVYYTGSNTWTTATALPGGAGRRTFAGGIMGNNLFAACGFSGAFRNDFYRGVINPGNPTLITWTLGPPAALMSSRPGGTAINGRFYVVFGELSGGVASDTMGIYDTTSNSWSYVDGKPNRTSNLWGAVSASWVTCNNKAGIKIWVPGGALGTQSNRPLDVFADTCLAGCSLTGIISNNNEIPNEYALFQNYPNPFNPETKISYMIPKGGNVKLVVYDLLGREVAVLVNEFKQSGRHTVDFNAENIASGVYFYRIEAGEFNDVKKMLLVK